MIEHIVLFKFADDVTDAQKRTVVEALRGLKSRIPDVVDLTAGVNFSDRARGYGVGLLVRVKDEGALQRYREHPEHVHVVNNVIKPMGCEVLALDYVYEPTI